MESSHKYTEEYASLGTIPHDVNGEEEGHRFDQVSFDQDEIAVGTNSEDGKDAQEYAPWQSTLLSIRNNVDGEAGNSLVDEASSSFEKEFGEKFFEDPFSLTTPYSYWEGLYNKDCGVLRPASESRYGTQDSKPLTNLPNHLVAEGTVNDDDEERRKEGQVPIEGANSVEPVSSGNKQEDSAVQKSDDVESSGVEMEHNLVDYRRRRQQRAYYLNNRRSV